MQHSVAVVQPRQYDAARQGERQVRSLADGGCIGWHERGSYTPCHRSRIWRSNDRRRFSTTQRTFILWAADYENGKKNFRDIFPAQCIRDILTSLMYELSNATILLFSLCFVVIYSVWSVDRPICWEDGTEWMVKFWQWQQEAQLPQRDSASATDVFLGSLTDRALYWAPRLFCNYIID